MAKAKERKKSSTPSKKWKMIKENRKICPKCGKGIYLGLYKNPDRYYCGKCHYTEFIKN